MQTVRILQAVCLLLVLAMAASCATSNEYVSKLFGPRPLPGKDSSRLAVRFLELDSINGDDSQWVKTDLARKDSTAPVVIASPDDPVAKSSNPETPLPVVQGTRNKKTRD